MGNTSCIDVESQGLVCSADRPGSFHAAYSLGQELGKGGQAKVHLCRHRETGQCQAVKVFDRGRWSSSSTYKRELELLQAYRSEHHIRVVDHYQDSDNCYLVMERLACHLRS